MGEEACQLDSLDRPSLGLELTSEAISISIGDPLPQLHSEVLNIFSMYVWPKFGHSTTLNNKGYRAHKLMGSVS